jgi:hypothetical protein
MPRTLRLKAKEQKGKPQDTELVVYLTQLRNSQEACKDA